MKDVLLLASQSVSRQSLLQDSGIPFKVITQTADEKACDWSLTIEKVVESIALFKMKHVVMPAGKEG